MAAPMERGLLSATRLMFRKTRHISGCHNGFGVSFKMPTYRMMSSAESVKFLPRGTDSHIAYRVLPGKNPGIVFLPGFQSHMRGVKALALEEYCRQNGLAFTRFDYQGCGESGGDLRHVTLSDWRDDAVSILDQVTAGPQILVGSSLGGLLMLKTALQRPHRIHSLVGIATAADFPERAQHQYPPEVYRELDYKGHTVFENIYGNYVLTKKFLTDAKQHNLMEKESIPIKCPVRLLHGMKDDYVPYTISLEVAKKLHSNNVLVLFRKKGEHRFSQPEDIQLIFEELDYLIRGSQEARDLAITSWSSFTYYSHPGHLVDSQNTLNARKFQDAGAAVTSS